MSNVLITKFPITAPDGTEYRVEIGEFNDMLYGRSAQVSLHVPVKRHKFERVFTKRFLSVTDYSPDHPDYVDLATTTITDYTEIKRKKTEAAARKQAAVERFNAWDGKITEEGA